MKKLNKCYIDFCNAQDAFQSEFVKSIAANNVTVENADWSDELFYILTWNNGIDIELRFSAKITDKSIDMDLLSLGRIYVFNDNKYYSAIRLRLDAANKEYELKQQMEK